VLTERGISPTNASRWSSTTRDILLRQARLRTWATWVTEHGAPNLQYSPYKKKVPQCMAYFIMKKEACFAHGAPTHQDGPG
jgi:hypothetical protein